MHRQKLLGPGLSSMSPGSKRRARKGGLKQREISRRVEVEKRADGMKDRRANCWQAVANGDSKLGQ